MKLTIAIKDNKTFNIFKDMFSDTDVLVLNVNALNVSADTLISPANSFGIMDGGIDKEIIEKLGSAVQSKVFAELDKNYFGEINIGEATIVKIDKMQFRNLLVAPTMRVPSNVSNTNNAYVAFRAALKAIVNQPEIHKVVTPVFCTGVGRMDPYVAATQMKMAYRNIIQGQRLKDFDLIKASNIKMLHPDYVS